MERLKEKIRLFIQFIKEAKTELKKVSWPSRKETAASTVVVLVLIILAAIYLGMVDLGLSNVIKALIR
jgi:preprotein translocase subunit SecE